VKITKVRIVAGLSCKIHYRRLSTIHKISIMNSFPSHRSTSEPIGSVFATSLDDIDKVASDIPLCLFRWVELIIPQERVRAVIDRRAVRPIDTAMVVKPSNV